MSEVIGYSDRFTVRPGERVGFYVGASRREAPYSSDVVRTRCADLQPGGAGLREERVASAIDGQRLARPQRIDRGSRGVVAPSEAFEGGDSFSVQVVLWPTRPGRERQALVGTWDESRQSGFALYLDERGAPALLVGDGRGGRAQLASDTPLRARQWLRLSATYDAATGRMRLVQSPEAKAPAEALVSPERCFEHEAAPLSSTTDPAPLVFAAWRLGADERGPVYGAHFDGKLEAPRLARGALSEDGLRALAAASPEDPKAHALGAAIVGWWDFAREPDGRRLVDLSPNRLHGELENLPTRAVTGAAWDGREHDWRRAPEAYAAIHFHSDDLYDAGWERAFELEIPQDWRSGIYAVRLRHAGGVDRIPFFVAPPKGRAQARLALLIPTATYLAYANMPDPHGVVRKMVEESTEDGPPEGDLQSLLSVGEYGLSCYHVHADGSGVHHSSQLRPITNMRPRDDLWAFNADTLISDWLEAKGIEYDVISDDLLHAEGEALLEPYRVVVTGTHPEYTSTPMLDALEGYLGAGGRLVYLGANGFYWRIAYSEAWPGAIELRRAEDGTRAWESRPGEYHHAWGGKLGGLWRRIGRPPNRLVGVGFSAQGFLSASAYATQAAARDPRAAFVFEGVEAEVFGDHGRLGGAAAEEIDRFDPRLGSPPHALVLATADRFAPDMLKTKEEFLATVPPDPADPDVRADVVFFETPRGGAVFSTGSIGWAGSLAHRDHVNDVSRVTENVVRRFLDPAPFEGPEGRG